MARSPRAWRRSTNRAVADNCDIHCPRFGAGLAGGQWPFIESLILEQWCDHGIEVFVYDYDADRANWKITSSTNPSETHA